MTPTKLRDINKRSDVRKQRIRPRKITWPVAPDGYIPNSVVRSLAPYLKFNRSHSCASKGLQVKAPVEEDKTLILTEQLNYLLRKHFRPKEEQQSKSDDKDGVQSVPEETNIRASPKPFQSDVSGEKKTGANFIPLRRGVPQRQYLLQTRQKFLQQNATSVEELQTNTSSTEEIQTNASCVEELQTNAVSIENVQTNAASVEGLKNEEDFIHPPKIVPQSLSEKSNAYPTKQAKKVKKGHKASFRLPEGVSVSPRLHQEKELQQEISSFIKEQKKSFQDSINKNGHVPKIGDPNQNMRKKTNLKKLKSFVPPVLPVGDRRPNSVLMYLYKRSKAESSPSDGVKWAPKEAWTTIRYYKN